MNKISIHIYGYLHRHIKKHIKNDNNEEFDDIIKNLLIKIFDIYYLERDIQKYNIDNVFKKYNMNMYSLLKRKYILTKSRKLIFKKCKYDKREYIMFFLNNIVLNEDETYKSIIDEILKSNTNCYSKYVNDYCKNRIVDKKYSRICFYPHCLNKVINDNYCFDHQDKKCDF